MMVQRNTDPPRSALLWGNRIGMEEPFTPSMWRIYCSRDGRRIFVALGGPISATEPAPVFCVEGAEDPVPYSLRADGTRDWHDWVIYAPEPEPEPDGVEGAIVYKAHGYKDPLPYSYVECCLERALPKWREVYGFTRPAHKPRGTIQKWDTTTDDYAGEVYVEHGEDAP